MNILVVAYYYPPIVSGGSERPKAMAKYLPGFGHQVRVLTHSYQRSDWTDPECTRIYDCSHNRDRRGIHFPLWLGYRLTVELFNRLGINSSIFSFWKRNVLYHAEVIMRQRPHLIIATYPPAECLEIGLILSEKFAVPLLADFRDGLIFEPIESKLLQRFASIRKHYQALEKQVAEKAVAITTVSPQLSDYFSRQYAHPDVSTIANGFDEDDYELVPPSPLELEEERFHIVHTGGFALSDPDCDISQFIQALHQLFGRREDLRHKIRIHLMGLLSRREKKLLREFIDAGIVTCYGLRIHQTALILQIKADLLLLITSTHRSSVATSKIFEYLRSGRPILALTGQTYAAQLVEETGTGWTADANDAAAIAGFLERIVGNPAFYAAVQPEREQIDKIISFSRLSQMQKLDAVIKRIAGKG